ncbi:MAG: CDC48 family AAA ATPase [Candidatus Melainabacteria bacterium]|nr:CDC48 family AAA ATPase [Candidatus Melainabacteria bacterium]
MAVKSPPNDKPAPKDDNGAPGQTAQQAKIRLRVKRAIPKDVGRGIIRMDPEDMESISCKIGDIVGISGQEDSVARVLPTYINDRGKGLAFLDGLLRENAHIGLEDYLTVYKVAAQPATAVTLTALSPGRGGYDVQYLGQFLEGLALVEGDRLRADFIGATGRDFRVVSAQPKGPVILQSSTRISLQEAPSAAAAPRIRVSYEDIGGLTKQIGRIREMIELPLKYPQVFERLGIEPPKGVLLYGAPGCGKTLVARAVASETQAHFVKINGPEIIHKFYGESEARLRSIFEDAARKAPTIIFIDEIDAIAPKRAEVLGEVEKRVVAQLLSLMDGLQTRGQVIVIGATNIPDALDPALRRPGRFDRELMFPAPDKDGRLEILQIHTRAMPLAPDVDLQHLGSITHGFVGADLAAVCREAAMNAVRDLIPHISWETNEVPYDLLMALEVHMAHFNASLREIEPSALRDIIVEVPEVGWADVGGLQSVKQVLIESVNWPLRYADLFAEAKVSPPRGIMLSGPPGTGKTLLARALAKESEANFLSIKGPALFSKWVGESEKGIRELFRKARQSAPAIVFLDEIDAMAARRGTGGGDSGVAERVISQLLTEMDGIQEMEGVIVVAATNRPDLIDAAIMRPGRFDFHLELPAPDEAARLEILKIHTKGRPLEPDIVLEKLASELEGYVGADIASIVNKASVLAIREYINQEKKGSLSIGLRHFREAIDARK